MSYAVNNVATTDQYQYLSCPHTIRVSVQVFNNPILIGFGKGSSGRQGSEVYATDEYLAPTSMIDARECDAIRFKSATPGVSAQVTIVATPGHEVPHGHPLGSGFTPNYLTIDPVTGAVSANFSGHVSAHGLDLEAPTTATPPEDDKVRWIRTADGAVVAEASGFRDLLSRNFAKLLARTPGGVIDSRVSLTARDETALRETWLQVRRDRSSSSAAIVAHTDETGDFTLLDDLGRSDYAPHYGDVTLPVITPGFDLGLAVTPGTNVLRLVRVYCQRSGSLRDVTYRVATTQAVNCILAAYDVGDAVAGTYTRLWTSAAVAIGASGSWQTIDPGAGVIPVRRGQHVMLAVIFAGATAQFGGVPGISSANQLQLPANFTLPGNNAPKLGGTFSPGSFTAPATITEVNLTLNTPPMMYARIA